MNVAYLGPLRRAMARARSMLFQPFRMETWLTLGFAAFLSQWLSGTWGGSGWHERLGSREDAVAGVRESLSALVWGPLVAAAVVVAIVLGIVVLWLGSRGKFIFLDDVVRRRTAIQEPWRRFARLGNSLFLWRLGFVVVAGVVMLAIVLGVLGTAVLGQIALQEPVAAVPAVVVGVALAVLAGLLTGFVSLMLDDFVAPLMYRHDIPAAEAWRRFLPLLRSHLGSFVLYALFVSLLLVVVWGAVVAVGFATCCVGLVLMALPYVGHVILLPVHVAFRGLGPEFLAQFGPEFDAFAGPAGQPAAPESAAPAGPGPWMPA